MDLVSCLRASLRSLRCQLLVVARMGALPTSGGEPGRDAGTDAETIDVLSLTVSLAGVSGRCPMGTIRDMSGDMITGDSILAGVMTLSVFDFVLGVAETALLDAFSSSSVSLIKEPRRPSVAPFLVSGFLPAACFPWKMPVLGKASFGAGETVEAFLKTFGEPSAGNSSSAKVGRFSNSGFVGAETGATMGSLEVIDDLSSNPGGGRLTPGSGEG